MTIIKLVTVTLLLCAAMALSEADPGPNPEPESEIAPLTPRGKTRLFKRSTCCPSGWTFWSGRCYLYISSCLSWARAERNCQSKGAHLASVHSTAQYHVLQWLVVTATHKYGQTWLGGSDAQEEGIWFWSDGSAYNYRYHGGFDNAGGAQHCLQMNWGVHKHWDDIQCNARLPSICSRKL